jgi:two-component system KDP operon response regulator KdpE
MEDLRGKTILIIDDEPELLTLAELSFSRTSARILTASDGDEGLRLFYIHQPDVVILDLMMPNVDGWAVCRSIRQLSDTPIILLTALSADKVVVDGLDCGADEFISKPVSPTVLLARTRAVLRRTDLPPPAKKPTTYHDGYLTIDLDSRRVLVREKSIKLSPIEYRLFSLLFKNAGRVLSCEQILRNVWGEEYSGNIDYVHVYMRHLRKKLEDDPAQPVYLLTEYGIGYRFEKQTA